MSFEIATVLALLGVSAFLFWWSQSLTSATIWSSGLRYLFRGVSIGLMLPIIAYVSLIQEAPLDSALVPIVDGFYSVVFWLFIIVITFLLLAFLFDLLSLRRNIREGF